jgi:hypothetical protein
MMYSTGEVYRLQSCLGRGNLKKFLASYGTREEKRFSRPSRDLLFLESTQHGFGKTPFKKATVSWAEPLLVAVGMWIAPHPPAQIRT